MIVPVIGLPYHTFETPRIEDRVTIVKEKDNLYDEKAIAVYNSRKEKMGYIGKQNAYNKKVYSRMLHDQFIGRVWAIFKNHILIEIEFERVSTCSSLLFD